jgi:hypothetical protein
VISILAGAALGLISGAFGAYVLFKVVKLLGPGDKSPNETAFTFLGFLLKWPVIFGLGYLSYKLSMEALYAFAIGVFVVYSATVWRALRVRLF